MSSPPTTNRPEAGAVPDRAGLVLATLIVMAAVAILGGALMQFIFGALRAEYRAQDAGAESAA